MTLYHFTSLRNLASIKMYGIIKGDVPITMMGGYNAPWLTSDSNPSSQGWTGGGDKDKVRLTIEIPDGDHNLWKWTDVMKEHLETLVSKPEKELAQKWFDILNETGGGQDNWYIYKGVVSPKWIGKVDFL